jgi:hypothetical protein
MRRNILIVTLSILFVLFGMSTIVLAFVEFAPINAEQKLFPIQEKLEHSLLVFYTSPTSKSAYELRLLEKRVDDLSEDQEIARFNAVWVELEHVLQQFELLPADAEGNSRIRFVKILGVILEKMEQFTYLEETNPTKFKEAYERIFDLRMLALDSTNPLSSLINFQIASRQDLVRENALQKFTTAPIKAIQPHRVPFLPGSVGEKHDFFPLLGQHADISCESCHVNLTYAGIPNQCVDCHSDVLPKNHYAGICSLCHTPEAWKPANFDHSTAEAADCQGCHLRDKPTRHYSGQCSSCHSTDAWIPASFDHSVAGATDCLSCHAVKKPANHFSGQCSSCHSTNAWKPATFNHSAAGATNCQSCHLVNKPANHFSGQCSSCHSTIAWKPATFNHSAAGATDCQSCHSNNKPANHFSGQCSSCHSTNAWKPATFNHSAAGATDCQSCHSGNKPANHFAGQCSSCHSTDSWSGASFSHSFPMNHGKANGECAQCHPSGGSSWTCFNCHSQSKMTEKHEEKGIPDYVVRCLECHGNGRKNDD